MCWHKWKAILAISFEAISYLMRYGKRYERKSIAVKKLLICSKCGKLKAMVLDDANHKWNKDPYVVFTEREIANAVEKEEARSQRR